MRFRSDPVQKIALVPFLMGGILVLIGQEVSLPAVTGFGAILMSVAPAAIGLHAIAKGRITLRIDRYGEFEEAYSGIGARAWGLLFLLSGAAVGVYGLLKLGGIEGAVERAFDRWPGLAAAAIGLGLTLYGAAQASNATILRRGQKRRVCILPERIGGAATALVGLTLVAGGALHAAAPSLFDSLVQRLGRTLLSILERLAR